VISITCYPRRTDDGLVNQIFYFGKVNASTIISKFTFDRMCSLCFSTQAGIRRAGSG